MGYKPTNKTGKKPCILGRFDLIPTSRLHYIYNTCLKSLGKIQQFWWLKLPLEYMVQCGSAPPSYMLVDKPMWTNLR